MDRKELQAFLEAFEYPQGAADAVLALVDELTARGLLADFAALSKPYDEDRFCDYAAMFESVRSFAEARGLEIHAVWLLFLIFLTPRQKAYYRELGIDERIWFTSMQDLKFKAVECGLVWGFGGVISPNWYPRFYELTRFGFGKLQFEPEGLRRAYEGGGWKLPQGTPALNIHIPRTGTHLDPESLERSFREAEAFFRPSFGDGPVVFQCQSWLLFPRHRQMLKEGANLLRFMDSFDPVAEGEYDDYSQLWRLFDTEYKGDADALPGNTSLRRAYIDLVKKGEKTGWGYGVRVVR